MTKKKPRIPASYDWEKPGYVWKAPGRSSDAFSDDETTVLRGPIPGSHEPGFVEEPCLPVGRGDERFRMSIWRMGECVIIRSQEPAGPDGQLLWHLSISCRDRHPSWDEIKTARYRLLPHELTFAILLPPPNEYINVPEQDHVFHLWQSA